MWPESVIIIIRWHCLEKRSTVSSDSWIKHGFCFVYSVATCYKRAARCTKPPAMCRVRERARPQGSIVRRQAYLAFLQEAVSRAWTRDHQVLLPFTWLSLHVTKCNYANGISLVLIRTRERWLFNNPWTWKSPQANGENKRNLWGDSLMFACPCW